jgi:hypothetical protein
MPARPQPRIQEIPACGRHLAVHLRVAVPRDLPGQDYSDTPHRTHVPLNANVEKRALTDKPRRLMICPDL